MMRRTSMVLGALLAALCVQQAAADMVTAQCEVRPGNSKTTVERAPCSFYQAQGHVTITLADGAVYDLTPTEGPGNYVDADGQPAYRKSGLGEAGLIFAIKDQWIYVYW